MRGYVGGAALPRRAAPAVAIVALVAGILAQSGCEERPRGESPRASPGASPAAGAAASPGARSAGRPPERAPEALERRMLDMVNAERKKKGRGPLKWDQSLADVGFAHSRDMLERDYFAHVGPGGTSPGDRALQAGVRFRILGENVAFAPNLKRAHDGLMKSPGHRKNILRPEFARFGVGILKIPSGAKYEPEQLPGKIPAGRLGGYLLLTQVFAR